MSRACPWHGTTSRFRLPEMCIRDRIQTKDGHVIAQTKVSSDASETREYPDGRMFAHVAGFAVTGKAGLEKQENFSLLRSHEFFLDQIVNDISGKKNTCLLYTSRCV